MLQYIFKAVLITSFAGTVLTLILTFLRPFTKKHFSAGWHYYVWLAVLAVMILPVRISLPQSIVPDEAVKIETPVIGEQIGENIQMPVQVIEETQAPQYIASESFSALKVLAESKIDVMSLIWFAGMIILFLAKIIGYVIFLIRLRKNSCVVLCPELTRFTDKKIITRRSAGISSPLLTGLFRPTLLLPEFSMTEEQLNNVLAHEMMHFKRKDILLKWLTAIVKCVHWFNPVIYYVSNQVDTECEISCDMAVVKEMTKEQEMGYVNTILALLAAGNSKTAALTTGMTSNKKRLKRRFTMIKNRFNVSKKRVVISVVAALLVLAATVVAGGILNGKLLNTNENEILSVETDADGQEAANLLLIGTDFSGKADTIMVLSLNESGVTGLSIPRDTPFAEHHSDNKIKKVSDLLAEENGDQKVIDAVRAKLSIPINYYAKINLKAVKEIVDSVGGIVIDVPMNMAYDDPHQNLRIDLKAGKQLLNGNQVCGLLQYRGYKDGDLTRISMAQSFVNEFIKQKLNKENTDKFSEFYNIAENNISTNITAQTVAKYRNKLENVTLTEVPFYTLPGKTVVTQSGISVFETDQKESEKFLADMGYTKEIKNSTEEITENKPKSAETNAPKLTETNNSQPKLTANSFVYPCEGEISAIYSVREHPLTGVKMEHNGIDIKAPEGTTVVASTGGTVTETGFNSEKGNYIVIEENGVKTLYSQLSSIDVNKGDKVTTGNEIGKVGKTGQATGSHLHFEVMINGEYHDPQSLLD